MKLSEETLSVIKNFSAINRSILFRQGNVVKTISPSKSVFAIATVKESFPEKCAIFELPRFLGALSLFDEPELDFGKESVSIKDSDGKRSVTYKYADENVILSAPEKDIVLPSRDTTFSMSSGDLQSIIKAAGVLGVRNIVLEASDGKMRLSARDVRKEVDKDKETDKFSIDLGEVDEDKKFTIVFNIENIVKLLPKDYEVTICSKGISEFKSDDLTYYVALEITSEYES
jgi:hypothetical protein